tara:strand:+ start:138 stop:704 length:567 start_codon:yes stop_codon:yes gene_type:complete
MACGLISRGRGLDCNRISGGIKNIYFAVYDQVLATTVASAIVTDVDMGTSSIYKYVMPLGVSSLTDTIVGSRENGTIYYTPTLNVILNRLTKEDQNEVKLLGATRTIIFAELNEQLTNGHNVIVCLGITNGMELNAGTMDSGAAWGDRNGYTLTFDGMESDPFPMVVDYTATPFDNTDSGAQIPIITS